MPFVRSGWWTMRTVFLKRGNVFRCECTGFTHVDFETVTAANRYVELQNRAILRRRMDQEMVTV